MALRDELADERQRLGVGLAPDDGVAGADVVREFDGRCL
jgi:hypothetical protein